MVIFVPFLFLAFGLDFSAFADPTQVDACLDIRPTVLSTLASTAMTLPQPVPVNCELVDPGGKSKRPAELVSVYEPTRTFPLLFREIVIPGKSHQILFASTEKVVLFDSVKKEFLDLSVTNPGSIIPLGEDRVAVANSNFEKSSIELIDLSKREKNGKFSRTSLVFPKENISGVDLVYMDDQTMVVELTPRRKNSLDQVISKKLRGSADPKTAWIVSIPRPKTNLTFDSSSIRLAIPLDTPLFSKVSNDGLRCPPLSLPSKGAVLFFENKSTALVFLDPDGKPVRRVPVSREGKCPYLSEDGNRVLFESNQGLREFGFNGTELSGKSKFVPGVSNEDFAFINGSTLSGQWNAAGLVLSDGQGKKIRNLDSCRLQEFQVVGRLKPDYAVVLGGRKNSIWNVFDQTRIPGSIYIYDQAGELVAKRDFRNPIKVNVLDEKMIIVREQTPKGRSHVEIFEMPNLQVVTD